MDVIKRIESWLKTEPNQSEVIVMRRQDNDFEVTVRYGNVTTVPAEGRDLAETLGAAIRAAERLPSAQKKDREKSTMVNKQTAPVKLPGMG